MTAFGEGAFGEGPYGGAMTDAQLRDAAVAEFKKTTDPYPTWVKKGKPSSSHWAKGFALLAQIGGSQKVAKETGGTSAKPKSH